MSCELWVRGSAWNGSSQINVDVLWRSGYTQSQIPQVAYQAPTSGNSSTYTDGLGGNFSGTGWYESPQYYLKNCTNLIPNQPYDCINGGCVPKTTYMTPGKYENLAACQSGCAKDSPCTGECVSPEQIAALQQAASNVRSRLCK